MGGCSLWNPTYQADRDQADAAGTAIVELTVGGNEGIGVPRLRREIEDYLIDVSRDPQREGAVFDAAEDLRELYRASGYPEARVDYALTQVGDGDPPRVRVAFSIEEGPLVVIDEPTISGNQHFDDETLRRLWSRQQSGLLGLGDAIFVAAEFDTLAADIQALYQENGFLLAAATAATDHATGTSRASAHLTIDEGPRFEFATVELDPPLRAALEGVAPRPPTGWFSATRLQDYSLALRATLRRRGHPKPAMRVASTIDAERRQVRVAITGEPGRRAAIGEIEIEGNEKTSEALIRNRLALSVGDRYDGDREDAGLRRLYLTGLFTKVRIRHDWLDGDRIRVTVEVEEDRSRALEAMVGYGSYERLRAGLRYDEKNLLGSGLQLTMLGRISQRGYRTGISLTNPYLFGTETALTVGSEFFERQEPSFRDRAVGSTVSLSRRLLSRTTGRIGYSFRDHADALAQVVDPGSRFVDYVEGRVFAELKNDHRDNILFPKSGHEQFVLFEVMDDTLGADVSFQRLRLGATAHLPLSENLRLVLRTEQGWLWPGDTSAEIPLQERFFNGGESTVRSFRESRLGPTDALGAPIGGEFRNILSCELRAPVWKTLEGSLFVDAGNVGRSVDDYGFDDLRYAVGAGLRLVLPIGPLRLDLAHNPDRELGEKEWVTHFSVGYPF